MSDSVDMRDGAAARAPAGAMRLLEITQGVVLHHHCVRQLHSASPTSSRIEIDRSRNWQRL